MKAYTIGNLGSISGILVTDHPDFGLGVRLEDKFRQTAYHIRFNKESDRQPEIFNSGVPKIIRAFPVLIKDKFYVLGKEEQETQDVLVHFIGHWRVEKGDITMIAAVNPHRVDIDGGWNNMQALMTLPLGTVVEIGERGNNRFVEVTETGAKTFGFREYKNRTPKADLVQPTPVLATANGTSASANGHTVTATPNVGVPIVLANGQLIEIDGLQAVITAEEGGGKRWLAIQRM